MKRKESLMFLNSFIYSFLVVFNSLELIFLFPLLLILYFERKDIFKILKKVFLLNFFILILVLFVFFQNQEEAIILFLRTNLILIFNVSIFHKSKGYDLVRGLDGLKFPSSVISVFYFTLTLINYLSQNLKETRQTLNLRGFKNNTSLFTYEVYGNVIGMILIKALKKSQEMQDIMKTRGFEDKIFFINSKELELSQKIIATSILVVFVKVAYELFS